MEKIKRVLKKRRSFQKKLVRLYDYQIRLIEKEARAKDLKFNEALRQILDHYIAVDEK